MKTPSFSAALAARALSLGLLFGSLGCDAPQAEPVRAEPSPEHEREPAPEPALERERKDPAPKAVCAHLVELMAADADARGNAVATEDLAAMEARCLIEAESQDGAAYQARADCVMAAEHFLQLHACEPQD